MKESTLRLTEIFFSLQGEARSAGLPTVFVRLTGCPLRCHYCDTEYAFHGGEVVSLEEILQRVHAARTHHVCVTGGEPLAQPNCIPLLTALCDEDYDVSLETSGALSVEEVDPRVSKVLDLKTRLTGRDQIKFVICDRADYEWARFKVEELNLRDRAGEVLFSPSYSQLEGRELAEWILADRLPVRFQMQLHKILWGDEPGR